MKINEMIYNKDRIKISLVSKALAGQKQDFCFLAQRCVSSEMFAMNIGFETTQYRYYSEDYVSKLTSDSQP